ncbi:MAG: hypothetical protein E7584_02045 [Ruminococcaceae bacterium]|nr:hypothetical protein [Oscillospiraceae bacterium]
MKKMPKKYKRPREQKGAASDSSQFLKSTVGTLLLTLAVGGALLLLCALILVFTPDPISLALPAGIICSALTAFIGGYFATRIYHLLPLSAGLINGVLLTALSLLFSLLFAKNAECYATGYSATVSALLHASLVGLSIGGAFVGARERMSNKKKRKKRR